MKLKLILSTLIFALAATFTFSQLQTPAFAIVPITSPVTSAAVQISGVVRYLSLSVFQFLPAAGADVMAQNKKTGDTYVATTDSDGNYNLLVPAGKYKLGAGGSGFATYKFVPKFNNLPFFFDFPGLDFFGLPKH